MAGEFDEHFPVFLPNESLADGGCIENTLNKWEIIGLGQPLWAIDKVKLARDNRHKTSEVGLGNRKHSITANRLLLVGYWW